MTNKDIGFNAIPDSEPEKLAQQIERLEEELQDVKDGRLEERFVFVVVVILLLNVVFFSVLPNFAGPVAMVVLELLILVPIARRMGMQEMSELLDRILHRATKGFSGRDS